jgi:MOSC domain-containing protein YiiM
VFEGSVESIHISARATEPLVRVDRVQAVAGRGLEGDRYFEADGTFPDKKGEVHDPGREVTLIEAETLEAIARDYDLDVDFGLPRRNIVTRGVPLNHLVGREFRVGDVPMRGVRLNGPCKHLASLTSEKLRESLVHRGGLRAQILEGGVIRVGDAVRGE